MPRDFGPPFCSSRMLMGSNDRAIDGVLLPIDLACGITLLLQGAEDSLPYSRFLPPIKSACHRAPRAIVLGEVSPRGSRSQNPHHSIDDQTMIVCWTASLWLLGRQQGAQLFPLLIRSFSSSHPFSLLAFCKHSLVLVAYGVPPLKIGVGEPSLQAT